MDSPLSLPVNQSMVITALKRTLPSNMAARNPLAPMPLMTSRGGILKASLALSRGNFSTMHSMFWSSVNLIVSSASTEWPHGQEWTERPRRS